MRSRWSQLIPRVEREEAALVGSLSLLHFLVILAFTLARIARDGLFLSQLSAQYLPYVSVGLAVWMVLAAHLFGRFTTGVAAHKGLSRAAVGTGFSLVLFSVWLYADGPAAAVAFYLWTGAYGVLLVSQFWIVANERINPRQARRLFGLIGAGGILGGMVGGTAASLLGQVIAPHGLLIFVAGVYWAAAALAERSGVRPEEGSPEVSSADTADGRMAESWRRPYVRLLVLLFLLGGITSGVLDYQFKYALQQRSSEAGQITSALGLFYGAQNLLALFTELGLVGILLSRFGARGVSVLLPGGLLMGSAITTLAPSFSSVLASRLYDATLRVSVARTAWEFLYFPLPQAANSLFRTAASLDEDRVLLQRTLWAMNRIRRSNEAVALPAAIVDQHLQEEVQLYLRLLVQRGAVGEPADDAARRLLVHVLSERIAQCRERIFRRLALLYPPRDILRAYRGLVSLSARVRAQAMEYLETILNAEHKALLAPLLDDAPEGERVRRAALSLNLAHQTLGETLRVLAKAEDHWLRACVLFAIGALRLADLSDPIEDNLLSPDPIIQETAVWAQGQLQRVEAKHHAG